MRYRVPMLTWAVLLATACDLPGSRCAKECQSAGECSVRTERAGDGFYRCYAATDAGCAASAGCRSDGARFVAEDGSCVRQAEVSARACAGSLECRVFGWCHPRLGFCEARSDADCGASTQCLAQGRCTHDAPTGLCKPSTAAHCQASAGCRLDGLCELRPDPFGGFPNCGLTEAGSCAHTIACTRYGRCQPRPDRESPDDSIELVCGRPDQRPRSPCSEVSWYHEAVCLPDGNCLYDAHDVCVRGP